MTSKALKLLGIAVSIVTSIGIDSSISHAEDRVGHFDEVQVFSGASNKVSIKAPGGMSSWNMLLPPNAGTVGQCIVTDGAGTTTWAGPFAARGANTDITSLQLADSTGNAGGIRWDDNDTRITQPSDGLISVYNNGVLSMQMTPNGPYIKGVTYVWPGGQGSAGTFLGNDGSGNLGWNGVPWSTPGPIGSSVANSGSFTTINANKINLGNGAAFDSCLLYDNDTGFCSSGDGAIEQWGNNVVGMRFDGNGPSEIRGVPIVFPNAQGTTGQVLTNTDGAGTLGWTTVGSPTGTTNTFAGFDAGSNLNPVPDWSWDDTTTGAQVHLTPDPDLGVVLHDFTADWNSAGDTGNNSNTFRITANCGTDDSGNGCLGGLGALIVDVGSKNLSSTGPLTNISLTGQVGNTTDSIVVDHLYTFNGGEEITNGVTVNGMNGWRYANNAEAGSLVGDTSFIRNESTVDHYTSGVSQFESRQNINEMDQTYFGFNDNNNIAHAGSNVNAFTVGGNWSIVDGSIRTLTSGEQVDTANDYVLNIDLHPQYADMPTVNTGYIGLNLGATVSTAGNSVGGLTEISAHTQVQGRVRQDMSLIEAGETVARIDRNLNYVNLHPIVTTIEGNANGYNDSTHITTISNGSYTGGFLNSQIDSLANNWVGWGINGRVTEAALSAFNFSATFPHSVLIAPGSWFSFGIPYPDGGQNFTPWFSKDGIGSAPVGQPNPIEIDISTGDNALVVTNAAYAAISSFSPLPSYLTFSNHTGIGTPLIDFMAINPGAANIASDQGGSGVTFNYATHGSGAGTATGLQINMSQVTGFSVLPKAIDSQGGTLNSQVTAPIAFQNNATVVNSIGTNFTADPGATITQADQIGLGTPDFLTVGAGATITSGSFRVGTRAIGGLSLLQIGTGATVQDVGGFFLATVPIPGGPDGGVIGNGYGAEIAALTGAATGSTTTFDEYKALYAWAPAGDPATSQSWGLWTDPNFGANYIGSELKIGSAGGEVPNYTLDVAGDINASNSVCISDDCRTAWPMGKYQSPTTDPTTPYLVVDDSTTISIPNVDRQIFYIAGSGGPIDLTAEPMINGCDGTTNNHELILVGTDPAAAVTIHNGFGFQIQGDMTISKYSTISLYCDGAHSLWVENTRTSLPSSHVRVPNTSTASATCSATCSGTQLATGGGCQNTAALGVLNSFPSSDNTWSCEYPLATGDCTAWVMCSN